MLVLYSGAAGGRSGSGYDFRQWHGGLRTDGKTAFVTAGMGISGGLDHSVYPHGHCRLYGGKKL